MTSFSYRIVKFLDGVAILIKDLDDGMTVTNNVEKVIEILTK